ncbi:MAG: TSUP family transporter [Spirochaetia bacterium]
MINLFGVELNTFETVLVIIAALCAGANKAGVHGVALISIPLLSSVLGVKAGTGYILLLFFASDCMAVKRYKLIHPKKLLQLLPLALLGLLAGAMLGKYLNDVGFKIMVTIVLSLLIVLLLIPAKYKTFFQSKKWIGNLFGFLGGFTSMAGNVGGPVLSTYMLAQNMPKNIYLSTYSWFFFTINFIKMFIMIFYWKTITWPVIQFFAVIFPVLVLGFALGAFIVKRTSDARFNSLVTVLTILSCVYLFYTMFTT